VRQYILTGSAQRFPVVRMYEIGAIPAHKAYRIVAEKLLVSGIGPHDLVFRRA
jgi:hypothetical protein